MCPPAYLYNAPAGVPGSVTRPDETNVEPAKLVAVDDTYAQAFGIPMKYASGGISQFEVDDVATAFAGVLVREVPSISGSLDEGFTDNIPWSKQIQGLAVRGYVSVVCKQGTPARGGIVYVRVEADTGKNIGDFEASSDTTKSVALTATQAEWASDGKDADNNAELRIAR